jgi:hypothetical protein
MLLGDIGAILPVNKVTIISGRNLFGINQHWLFPKNILALNYSNNFRKSKIAR